MRLSLASVLFPLLYYLFLDYGISCSGDIFMGPSDRINNEERLGGGWFRTFSHDKKLRFKCPVLAISDRMRDHRLESECQAYMVLLLGPLSWPPPTYGPIVILALLCTTLINIMPLV